MKRILMIIALLAFIGCSKNNKAKRLTLDRPMIYNTVLDELVQNRFYGIYLGDDEELDALNIKYIYNHDSFDSIRYYREIEGLRKRILSDSSKRRSICLRLELRSTLKKTQQYYTIDSLPAHGGLKDLMAA